MTIDELIGEAERFATYAVREADRDRIDHDRIMRYTAIAQACAMTAGAMVQHAAIAAEWRQSTRNEYDAIEVADAAVYDANIAQWRKEQEQEQEQE